MIHESAIIDPSAKIADDVEIGAYSIIDKNVYISEGTVIKENVVIRENTSIGKNNLIYQINLKLVKKEVELTADNGIMTDIGRSFVLQTMGKYGCLRN